jgi:hypothetical protein
MFGSIDLPLLVAILVLALVLFGPRAFDGRGPF